MYTTGIDACDQLLSLNLQGNIIPQVWYKVFTKKDLSNPKPHLLAIVILSDIVYWYRPTEIRDEATGNIVGYKRRFNSDLLQRNYKQIAEQFGCSEGQAKDAIVFLEKMNVVKRIFRTMDFNGVLCNNVMFISLDVKTLKALTYPQENKSVHNTAKKSDTGVSKSHHRGAEISTEGVTEFLHTNTEITTKTTPEIAPSIYPQSIPQKFKESDGWGEEELQEIVEEELFPDTQIPYHYKSDKRKMKTAIKFLTGWSKYTSPNSGIADFEKETYFLLLDCLVEMACANEMQTYKGSCVSYAKVLDKINFCAKEDRDLSHFTEETINDYICAASEKEIHDKRKYMKSVIWNSFSTYKVKFHSMFERTYYSTVGN